MRTLAFDGRTGASGDILLGALLAAGADREALAPVEDALDVRYEVGEVVDSGITAVDVAVQVHGDADDHGEDGHAHTDGDDERSHGRDHGDGHSHDDNEPHSHDDNEPHSHDDNEPHSHDDNEPHSHVNEPHSHDHDEPHSHDGDHQRTYAEVVELVESLALPAGVEADALGVFELLGEAEASVHGTDLAETHFHEVGTLDAVADVVGVALLVADLAPERVVTTPVRAGGGEVTFSHGTYPVPAPAVVELAERADWELRGGPVERELLTPTGAALLAHFADGVERLPSMRVDGSGYGAGDADLGDRPNVLRATVGEREGGLRKDDVVVLETNLDDATPEVLGGLQDALAEAGARDVSVVPLTMKKSRPGHLVKVVTKPGDAERVARRLAAETGTLGVREAPATHRWIADRAFETVAVDVEGVTYEVSVKVATDDEDGLLDVSAEYDDARAVAAETGLPVREVLRRAETAYRERD